MSFSQKIISVTISLANGNFGSGGNSSTITGLRTSAKINNTGGPQQSTMELSIYGLSLSDVNQLTTFGSQYLQQYKNTISVSAGSDEDGMTTVFQGLIYSAYFDGQAEPQSCLRIQAQQGGYWAAKPIMPISFQGPIAVSTVAQQLAGTMGLTLENNGVTAMLSNPYFAGDAMSALQSLSEHAGFDYLIDKGTLAITAPGQSRSGDPPLISADTGMVTYPLMVSNTIVARALFNPAVKYNGNVTIQSDLTPACGTFNVQHLEYDLEGNVPHGKWFMTVTCTVTGGSTPQGDGS